MAIAVQNDLNGVAKTGALVVTFRRRFPGMRGVQRYRYYSGFTEEASAVRCVRRSLAKSFIRLAYGCT